MSVKQVIVIRRKYPSSKRDGEFFTPRRGKIIAQACHASMKIFFDLMVQDVTEDDSMYGRGGDIEIVDIPGQYVSKLTPEMTEWKEGDFKKVCVYVDHEEDLLNIVKKAEEANLPVALITDSGLTEFNGEQTNTCCAIGPAKAEEIDKITGNLPLL
jgi:PTH2 family peptidyl-tRNA hydrolase